MQLRLQPVPWGALELMALQRCSGLRQGVRPSLAHIGPCQCGWAARGGHSRARPCPLPEGHAWQAVGWGTRGEGEFIWEPPSASTAPSCPVNQSLLSEKGSGPRVQTGRGVSFFLTPGLGWRLALPRERGRSGRAAPSVRLSRARVFPSSSSSRPGGPAAPRHVRVTFCRSSHSHPAQPGADPPTPREAHRRHRTSASCVQ